MSESRPSTWGAVRWFGPAIAEAIVMGIAGWYTGSFETVAGFASGHPAESALWSVALLGLGLLVGLAIRDAIATRQLREKEAEISELRERPTQEDVERAVEDATAPLRDEIAEKDAIIGRLTSKPSSREMLERLLPGFSRAKLRAIVRAYDADGMLEADDESVVMASVQAGQGVFIMETMALHGMTRTTGRYALTDKFRRALSECPDILEHIRMGASGAAAPQVRAAGE